MRKAYRGGGLSRGYIWMKGKAGCLERKWSRFHSKAERKSGKASASSGPSFSGRLRRTLANIFAPALGVCGPFCLVGLLQIKLQRAAPKIPTLIITVCYLLKIRGRVQRYSVFTQRPNNKNECKCLLGSGHLATWPSGWKCTPGKTDPREVFVGHWQCQLPPQ